MQDFIYYNQETLPFPLSEDILTLCEIPTFIANNCIVSNSSMIPSEIIAKEIDFYIKNSQDSLYNQMKNIKKLYEINAKKFDYSQDLPYEQVVSNQLLVIGNNEEKNEFLEYIASDEFDVFHVDASLIKTISGHIGALEVVVLSNEKEVPLNVSQILWFNAKEPANRSGVFTVTSESIPKVVIQLQNNIQHYTYKKYLTYDSSICQYHERREEVCGKCEEVCPTVAIVKTDESKHLEFSDIDCLGCGGCISVCPSGALDYAPMNKESIFEIARLYENHIPLIVPQKMNIEKLSLRLKEGVLPLAIEGEKFLHESTLLTLLQESGSQIVFYTDFMAKGTNDAIDILNQIYQKKYGVDAILVAKNEDELSVKLQEATLLEESRYSINQTHENKRENFAIRLAHIVQNENLGAVQTGNHVHYGVVKVNEANCTLCLSCVGACNVNALMADAKDNTLRINPSLCTACGYCEISCPEKECLSIEPDVIKLEPSWFTYNVLAKDELYACIECGKEFATKKAVEKVAQMMAPIFSQMSKTKERTLYCCEDCKAKLMIKEGLLHA